MQDGAPPHYPLIVRNYLDQQFPRRWIGRGSEFPWPPRTPECNPLDFYFWGHMKTLVYSHEVYSREELWQQIVNSANFIANQPNIFFKVRRSFIERIDKLLEVNRSHIEHLL